MILADSLYQLNEPSFSLPADTPAYLTVGLAIFFTILYLSRKYVESLFARREQKFTAQLKEQEANAALELERKKNELDIELERRKSELVRDSNQDEFLGQLLSSLNNLAGVIAASNKDAAADRLQVTEERRQFMNLLQKGQSNFDGTNGKLDEVRGELVNLNKFTRDLEKTVDQRMTTVLELLQRNGGVASAQMLKTSVKGIREDVRTLVTGLETVFNKVLDSPDSPVGGTEPPNDLTAPTAGAVPPIDTTTAEPP